MHPVAPCLYRASIRLRSDYRPRNQRYIAPVHATAAGATSFGRAPCDGHVRVLRHVFRVQTLDRNRKTCLPPRNKPALPANSWRRVTGQDGKPTSLWQRSPLISLDELRQFAVATKGMRGNRRFAKAAKTVTGATASPFEAQTSILLTQSRRKGGEGFPGIYQ